jgi:hypothetical protein
VRVALVQFALTLALFGRLPQLPVPTPTRPPAPPPPAPVAREAPVPMLASLARVRVEEAHDRVLVIEEINLPRGEWQRGSLDLYVAFGTPGPPIAVDARLVTVPAGHTEARLDDAGEAVTAQPAARPSPAVQVVLGRRQMAGVALHVKESQLRNAYASSDLAVLRVRNLLHPPAAGDDGARDVVVRLGVSAGLPITLGRIQVASLESGAALARAQARLCGPEADPWPLSVALAPSGANPASGVAEPSSNPAARNLERVATIAPSLASRHASDDLCIRWWTLP